MTLHQTIRLLKQSVHRAKLALNAANQALRQKKAITTFITAGNPAGGVLAKSVAWLMS